MTEGPRSAGYEAASFSSETWRREVFLALQVRSKAETTGFLSTRGGSIRAILGEWYEFVPKRGSDLKNAFIIACLGAEEDTLPSLAGC
jgi:hypothetical protein